MLVYCFIVSALIVLVSTLHLKWWDSTWAMILSSVLLGSLVTLMVQAWGAHQCAEGKPPGYIAFLGGTLAGAVPWCHSLSMAIRCWLAFSIAMMFVTLVGLLVSSYHSGGITGNPKLANGRFWHTTLSGQYPRGSMVGQHEQALMRCMRERIHQLTKGNQEEAKDAEDESEKDDSTQTP